MKYIQRIADTLLADKLSYAGGVLITGPKYCGKTETAKQFAKSSINMEADASVPVAMSSDPNLLLLGDTPRLIDEWQAYPQIRNVVRHAIDNRRAQGQFILTGSATPNDETERRLHSGAGRISRMRMRTMSWSELGWSDGTVSLADIMSGRPVETQATELSVPEIAKRIAIGGWPALVGASETVALKQNRDYIANIVEVDISRVTGTQRDPVRVRKVIESYARNIATAAKNSTITSDVSSVFEDGDIDRTTVSSYLNDLSRMMITDDIPAWNTHIRSSAKLRVTPKRHFADASLAVAALNLSPALLLKELRYLGFLFESTAVHDLRIYAEALGGSVSYYLDTDDDEVDAIVEMPSGAFAAFEVKLGIGAVEEAVLSLNRFVGKLTDSRKKHLVSRNIIVGAGMSYTRPDGINVISLGSLGA